jgi:hypothetical protein
MRHHNSLLHQLLQFVPWSTFDQLVERYEADARVRRLTTKSQFVALLHGQLSGAHSLREIEATLTSQATRLYHVGAKAPARSTLADANARRPAEVFCDLFGALLCQAGRGLRRHAREAVHLLDATHLPLQALAQAWAPGKSGQAAAAKLHVDLDGTAGLPVHFEVTPARINDITVAKALILRPGETYVFDLGYYDFGWWRELHDAGCRFVTRLKRHTRPTVVETRPVADGGPIVTDRIVRLDGRLKSNRINPLAGLELREIEVVIATGTRLRIISNDLAASAETIAALYKARWHIELFFRWVKQNLKIRHFLGTSGNAVRAQIAVALIAFLLLRMAHAAQTAVPSILTFTRLVRANLMHRRALDRLKGPPDPKPPNHDQSELDLC